jgi:hypothetical protein
MVWLYFALAVAAASGACLVGWLFRNKPANRPIVAWACGGAGIACLFLFFAIEGEYGPLILGGLGVGLTCLVVSILLLIVSRRTPGAGGQS